jgi:tripartite motif-containing protein 2/3
MHLNPRFVFVDLSEMANAAPTIMSELEGITECPICAEIYVDPRTLPCLHTYCMKCIAKYARDKEPSTKMACPVCRTEFVIPPGGVSCLQKNFFMEKMKCIRELLTSSDQISKLCDTCKCEDRRLATVYCTHCQEKMCDDCSAIHGQMKISRHHKQVAFSDRATLANELRSSYTPATCEKHTDKILEVYCLKCEVVLCMMCFIKQHQGHECCEVSEVADNFRSVMTADVGNMIQSIEYFQEAAAGVNKEKERFLQNVKQVEGEICERADQLKALVDTDKRKVLGGLEVMKRERLKAIENTLQEVEQHIAVINSLKRYVHELNQSGNASEIAREQSALHNRTNELLASTSVDSLVSQFTAVDIVFATRLTSNEENSNMVGSVCSKRGSYCDGAY